MEEAEEVFCSVSTPHTSTMAGCGAFFLVFNLLQQDGGDKGNGDSGYTFKFNDHSLTALDTTNDSCDTIKNTTCNQNVLAFLAYYRLVVEEHHTVVGLGSDAHEILHLSIGHRHNGMWLLDCSVHHIAQRLQHCICRFQTTNPVFRGGYRGTRDGF